MFDISDNIRNTSFDHVREFVYLYPCDMSYCTEGALETEVMENVCPHLDTFGIRWYFSAKLENHETFEYCFVLIDYGMMETWKITETDLTRAVRRSLNRGRPNMEFSLLGCEEEPSDFLPFDIPEVRFLRIRYNIASAQPPFPAELMFSSSALQEVHACLGDFFLYPYDQMNLYATAAAGLQQTGLSPYMAFRKAAVPYLPEGIHKISDKIFFCGSDGDDIIIPEPVNVNAFRVIK